MLVLALVLVLVLVLEMPRSPFLLLFRTLLVLLSPLRRRTRILSRLHFFLSRIASSSRGAEEVEEGQWRILSLSPMFSIFLAERWARGKLARSNLHTQRTNTADRPTDTQGTHRTTRTDR
jgi:hypothetical protein